VTAVDEGGGGWRGQVGHAARDAADHLTELPLVELAVHEESAGARCDGLDDDARLDGRREQDDVGEGRDLRRGRDRPEPGNGCVEKRDIGGVAAGERDCLGPVRRLSDNAHFSVGFEQCPNSEA
jgi:hypothetical protein